MRGGIWVLNIFAALWGVAGILVGHLPDWAAFAPVGISLALLAWAMTQPAGTSKPVQGNHVGRVVGIATTLEFIAIVIVQNCSPSASMRQIWGIARYKLMTLEQIGDQLQPLSRLFAWQQGGDETGPRKLISAQIQDDEGLVRVLELLTGRVRSAESNGIRETATLSRANVQTLIDYDDARSRIHKLAEHSANGDLRTRAQALRRNFGNGDRF